MNEFFNWHDFGIVLSSNWIWLLLAAAIGIWRGWVSTAPAGENG
ncbi:MAG: hypothetical protein U1E15_12530 [Hyphomicrobiales bacterium]